MSVKLSSNEDFQVVFLIDENSSSIYDRISVKDASNSVCLCVLRILTYFNELRNQSSSSLRWGFKFYNSRSLNQRYQRHNFKEFCVSEFDNFEKGVSDRFNEEFAVRSQTQEQNEELCSGNEFSTNTTTIKSTALKSLTCALTDLVHDFQWEINDLNSPLQTTRRSNVLQQSSRKTRNIVFLLTKCPTSFDALREFSGSKIEDFNTLRNAIMSPDLFKEFNNVYKIKLNWINTDCCEHDVTEQDVIDMMSVFLQMFNGSLIPLQSLVRMQIQTSSPPGGINVEDLNFAVPSSLILPVMSVLSHYMGELKHPAGIDQTCVNALELKNSDERTVNVQDCSNLWAGWLCSPGVKPMAHCILQLSSILSPTKSCAATSSKGPTLTTRQQSNFENSVLPHTITTTFSDNPSVKMENENAQTICPNVFWIKGALKKGEICPSWFHLTKVYSCVATVTGQHTEKISSAISGWFQRLMIALSKQNLSLVIELRDPESGTPTTAVLQPLTSICGVLNVVNSCKLLTLEKLLLIKRNSSTGMKGADEHYLVEDFNVPKITDGRSLRVLRPSEIHCPLSKQSSDACSSEMFSAQDLNSWSLGLACLEQGPQMMPQTSSPNCSYEGNIQESSLIKALKDLYSSKKAKQLELKDKTAKAKQNEIKKRLEMSHEQVKKNLKKEERLSSNLKETNVDELQLINCSNIVYHNNDSNKDDNESTSNDKEEEIKLLLEGLQLNVDQDLKDFLRDAYQQALSNFQMEGLTSFIEKCVAVIDWYLKKSNKLKKTQKLTMQSVLTDHLIMSNQAVRDKYEQLITSECKQTKLIEYQLQVLLRLEILCTGHEQQDNTSFRDEIVIMLRSISFIKDPGFLRDFLKEIILTRYVQHIPKFLCEIYEGLMQDLPPELLSPSKQNSEEEDSPLKRCQIPLVERPESDQPCSNTSRPLTRHRSVADIGGKRREIVVPGKVKTDKRKRNKKFCLSSNQKSNKHEVQLRKTPVKKVRRNLFTKEEETPEGFNNSTGLRKKTLKVPSIFTNEAKYLRHRHKASRRHSVAADCISKVVRETPGRKQIDNALWQKQHRARKRTSTISGLNIVKESPLKDVLAAETIPRRSPRKHPGSIFQRSQSFYGQYPSSCPLIKSRSSSSVRSRSPIKKLDLDNNADVSNLITDTMETSTTPVKMISEKAKQSPLRFSPRIRKRFTLHTLLTETSNTKTGQEFFSRTKALTPKSKQEAPVRSSPRLLKKRSFSCIGFSNSSLFSNSKYNGDNVDSVRKINTSSKENVLSPTRSSPRFKRNASDSCQMARNQETLSCLSERKHVEPEFRKKLQSPSCVGHSNSQSIESANLDNVDKKSSKVFTDSMMDYRSFVHRSNNLENDEYYRDSEVILNFNKQPSTSVGECDSDRSKMRSPVRGYDAARQEASFDGKDRYQGALPSAKRKGLENSESVDLVDAKESNWKDQSKLKENNSQKTSSFDHGQENDNSASQCRTQLVCNFDRHGDSKREFLSQKRQNFSPSKKMKMRCRASETAELGCLDNENDKSESNKKMKLQNDVAVVNIADDFGSRYAEVLDNMSLRTRLDETQNSAEINGKIVASMRRSPQKHRTKKSPVCASQRLLTPKPVSSTPPPRKQRKLRSQTEKESKRSSPLNQILKQRKRNRPDGLHPLNTKVHSQVGSDTDAQKRTTPHKSPRETTAEEQAKCFARLAADLLDECSTSSDDMVFEWFTDKEEHPEMCNIPKIHRQNSVGLNLSSEEDDVFQNPSNSFRSNSGKRPYKPSTPISAKSIQTLRDSPLLLNSSFNVPSGSISKKWSNFSPKYGKERLKRRKRSEAFGEYSSELDTSTSDDGENTTDRNLENSSTRSRKRIKLETN